MAVAVAGSRAEGNAPAQTLDGVGEGANSRRELFPWSQHLGVARRHGVAANVLFRWRREALDTSSSEPPTFSPVTVAASRFLLAQPTRPL